MNRQEIFENNRARAERAREVLATISQDYDDEHTALIDLLANSMHLFGPGVVIQAAKMAEVHYNAELDGD